MRFTKKKIYTIINAVGFNLAWWTCVLGVKWSLPWLGAVMMAIYLLIHLRILGLGKREMLFIMVIGAAGTVVDSVLATTGVIHYEGRWPIVNWLAPAWIIAMWAGFAALINHSLKWLKGRYILAFLLGAIFGPPAYFTGVKFDVLEFHLASPTMIAILSMVWGLSIPAMVWLSQRMNVERVYAKSTS